MVLPVCDAPHLGRLDWWDVPRALQLPLEHQLHSVLCPLKMENIKWTCGEKNSSHRNLRMTVGLYLQLWKDYSLLENVQG